MFVGKTWLQERVRSRIRLHYQVLEESFAKRLKEFASFFDKRTPLRSGLHPNQEMEFSCDNKAAIDIFHNHVQCDRTKHAELDHHFLKL